MQKIIEEQQRFGALNNRPGTTDTGAPTATDATQGQVGSVTDANSALSLTAVPKNDTPVSSSVATVPVSSSSLGLTQAAILPSQQPSQNQYAYDTFTNPPLPDGSPAQGAPKRTRVEDGAGQGPLETQQVSGVPQSAGPFIQPGQAQGSGGGPFHPNQSEFASGATFSPRQGGVSFTKAPLSQQVYSQQPLQGVFNTQTFLPANKASAPLPAQVQDTGTQAPSESTSGSTREAPEVSGELDTGAFLTNDRDPSLPASGGDRSDRGSAPLPQVGMYERWDHVGSGGQLFHEEG